MNVNKVIVCGRLGANPELKYLPDGRAAVNVSLATSERWTDKQGEKQERTEWHRIAFFGKGAEVINQYSAKGAILYVEGKLTTRKWTDKQGIERYTTEIIGDQFQLGPRKDGQAASTTQDSAVGFGAPAQTTRTPPPGPLARDPNMGGANGVPAEMNFASESDIPF